MAIPLDIPKTTFHEILESLDIKDRLCILNKYLRGENKNEKVRKTRNWISSDPDNETTFDSFKDVIHIDGNWFHICQIEL